jgi:paraquat-inducible protein A
LHRLEGAHLDTAVALAISALVLFVIGNLYPIVSLNINGATRSATLAQSALGLYRDGFPILSVLVLLTTLCAPLFQVGALLYLLLPLRKRRTARHQRLVFRWLTYVRPWTFFEVFLLGAFVALVRLTKFAEVIPGLALVCCMLFMITLAALTNMTSPQQFWHWVEQRRA